MKTALGKLVKATEIYPFTPRITRKYISQHKQELIEIVDQLKSCNYICEAGNLENNIEFMRLNKIIDELNNAGV